MPGRIMVSRALVLLLVVLGFSVTTCAGKSIKCCECAYVDAPFKDGGGEQCQCRTHPETRDCINDLRQSRQRGWSATVRPRPRNDSTGSLYGPDYPYAGDDTRPLCILAIGRDRHGNRAMLRALSLYYDFDFQPPRPRCLLEQAARKFDDGSFVEEECNCDQDWCNCDPISGAGLLEATRSFLVAALCSFLTNRVFI